VVFGLYATLAAFTTYFSMYAFRKPFTVATFEGYGSLAWLPELDYKIVLIIAQVLGYTTSKFLGIKIISEMTAGKRALFLAGAILFAHAALALFAVLPPQWAWIALFLNGLPLGLVWGLTFGFLEGRRSSEALGAGLSASYIVASGAVKSVGKWVLTWQIGGQPVSEAWMPFITGLLFLPIFLGAVWMLKMLPKPNAADIAARMERVPMDAEARKSFFWSNAVGLTALTALYVLLTAYRDFRDNFARELWDALGYGDAPEVFALSEIPIAVAVLGALAALMLIKDNRKALLWVHGLMLVGTAGIGISTLLWQMGLLDPAAWMVLVGLGLYIAYVPYGCVLFDRLIAALGVVGTAGFLIYLTDAFGYLGSVALMLYRDLGEPDLSWLEFFTGFSYITSVICTALYVVSMFYFGARTREGKVAT